MSVPLALRHTADGTPYVRPYLGTNPQTGRQIRPYRSFPGASDEEAMRLAREWLDDVTPFARVGTSARVADVLDRYVRWAEDDRKAENTVKTWRSHARRGRDFPLGSMTFSEVRAVDVTEFYHQLRRPAAEGGAGLSGETARSFHRFLRVAWKWACDLTGAERNVMLEVAAPRGERHYAVAFDEADYAALLGAIEEEAAAPAEGRAARMRREAAMAALIAVNTGMRAGEVCALRRADVRANDRPQSLRVWGTVIEAKGRVYRQEATKNGRRRNIAAGPELFRAIRAHLAWHRELGERAGGESPVISAGRAPWTRPSEVSREFGRLCAERGLPREATFHSLRHTYATYALLHGAPIHVVSRHLGHSSPEVTLRVYAHLLPADDDNLAALYQRAQDQIRTDYQD